MAYRGKETLRLMDWYERNCARAKRQPVSHDDLERYEETINRTGALANRVYDFYDMIAPYDVKDAMEIGETEGDLVVKAMEELSDPEMRKTVLEGLERDVAELDDMEYKTQGEALVSDLKEFDQYMSRQEQECDEMER